MWWYARVGIAWARDRVSTGTELAKALVDPSSVVEPAQLEDLTVCPHCQSQLVYMIGLGPKDEAERWAWLRCPNCNRLRHGRFSVEQLEELDLAEHEGDITLFRSLQRLARENMADYVERATTSLDHIVPADF